MMNMTMDAVWLYFFSKFDVAIKRSVPLTSSKPKFKNVFTNKDVIATIK